MKAYFDEYAALLKRELLPALGCTEPTAIAYAAALARECLGAFPERVVVACSHRRHQEHDERARAHGGRAARHRSRRPHGPDRRRPQAGHGSIVRGGRGYPPARAGTAGHGALPRGAAGGRRGAGHPRDGLGGRTQRPWRRSAANTTISPAWSATAGAFARRKKRAMRRGARRPPTRKWIWNAYSTIAEEADLAPVAPVLERQVEYNLRIAEEGLKNPWGACVGRTLLQKLRRRRQKRGPRLAGRRFRRPHERLRFAGGHQFGQRQPGADGIPAGRQICGILAMRRTSAFCGRWR